MRLPPPLSYLYSAWMAFSKVLGKVMSFLILTVLWVVGFGIYAIIIKLGILFAAKKSSSTYWVDLPPPEPGNMRRQF